MIRGNWDPLCEPAMLESCDFLFLFAACDCHLAGTVGGNNSVCDVVSGQCSYNTTWFIGGRRCDRCEENAWNTSDSLFSCERELTLNQR